MVKPEDRRDGIVNLMTNYVLEHGLAAASLRPLAKAAGTSDRMLLYYFKDKSEIITVILDCVFRRLVARLNAQTRGTRLPLMALRAELMAILLADDLWPYMRIWLDIAARAARGDMFYRQSGEAIARGFLAWGASQLESDDLDVDAATLLISIEGMVLLKSVGLDDVCAKAR
jgi:AcrR family transcriptional regulator